MSEARYPSYLGSPEYKFRRFTINVKYMPDIGEGIDEAINKFYQNSKKALGGKFNKGNIVNDPNQIRKNLEKNYDDLSSNAETVYTITLPLPNNIGDSTSHSWDQQTGIAGGMVQGVEQYDIGQGFAGGKLSVGNILASAAESSNTRKPMADPGYFQNYNGTDLREFSFDFDFIPNNEDEALQVQLIIMKLKEFSSPESADGSLSMLAPMYFDIEIGNPIISGLINLHGVVLKSINLSYGEDGAMQFFPDGMPKYIKMSLTFAERRMVVANYFR